MYVDISSVSVGIVSRLVIEKCLISYTFKSKCYLRLCLFIVIVIVIVSVV
jgi:hypothetical protein